MNGIHGQAHGNAAYWLSRPGEEYERQQRDRGLHNNDSYQQQIAWLTALLNRALNERTGRTQLKLLDFGCGFGRLARVLTDNPQIDYYGFDTSNAMAAPLLNNPPPALAAIRHERIKVSEALTDKTFDGVSFDIIVTISVLIHNPEAKVREVLRELIERLQPEGKLILIENSVTAQTSLENFWHAGCWVHAFASYLPDGTNVEIFNNLAGNHAAYVISKHPGASSGHIIYHTSPDSEGHPCTLNELEEIGIERTLRATKALSAAAEETLQGTASLIGRVRDLEEQLSYELEQKQTLTAEIERLNRIQTERRQLSAAIRDVRIELSNNATAPLHRSGSSSGHPAEPLIAWDAYRDTRYAHSLEGFEGVLHIFSAEWIGIRAAAGSLPGKKLALSAERSVSELMIKEVALRISDLNPTRILFHGMSDTIEALVTTLSRAGWADRLYGVLHGAPAQWFSSNEGRYARAVLDLARSEKIKRLHVLKPNFEMPIARLYKPMLFNLSPKLNTTIVDLAQNEKNTGIVLIPGWAGWRKNIHTNAFGAALSQQVKEIWAFGNDLNLPTPMGQKVKIVPFEGREATFQLMTAASLVMNVSLVDCHPMVHVEAQSLGRACVRGPLFLDALEDHEYITKTQVNDVTSAVEIKDVIDRLLDMPPDERQSLALDYQRRSDEVAIARYREFLEI